MYVSNRKFNHFKVISLKLLLISGLFYAFNQLVLAQPSTVVANPSVDLDSWQFYGIVGYFTLSFLAVIFMRGKIVSMVELISRALTALTSSLIGAGILLYLLYGMPVFQSISSTF